MTPPNTETITFTITSKQLCVIAALINHKLGVIEAKGKESGRALFAEMIDVLEQEHDQDALTQATQTALTKLETAVTLEYYRVTFLAMNYTDTSFEQFQTALRDALPTCERYVTTIYDYNNPAGKPNDLGVHVYVPANAGQPNVLLFIEMVADLKGIQFDGVSPCWLGEKEAVMNDSWTLLT